MCLLFNEMNLLKLCVWMWNRQQKNIYIFGLFEIICTTGDTVVCIDLIVCDGVNWIIQWLIYFAIFIAHEMILNTKTRTMQMTTNFANLFIYLFFARRSSIRFIFDEWCFFENLLLFIYRLFDCFPWAFR